MSNEVKKAQEEMEKLMKQHMKDVYGENFENMGDLMKQALENSMANLENNIDIEVIQNAVPGVDMATIMGKMQEAKEEAVKNGTNAIEAQAAEITNAMNEMFSSGNTGLQDIISEQMKQFQAMTGIEDFTKLTPETMQNYYENQMNMWNGLEEDVSLEGGKAYQIIRELNEELKKEGYITIRGRINKDYLLKRLGVEEVA